MIFDTDTRSTPYGMTRALGLASDPTAHLLLPEGTSVGWQDQCADPTRTPFLRLDPFSSTLALVASPPFRACLQERSGFGRRRFGGRGSGRLHAFPRPLAVPPSCLRSRHTGPSTPAR